jgi:SAM-dependent methyltransferase/glycosyltransferase involved in cell wall biosynthesis
VTVPADAAQPVRRDGRELRVVALTSYPDEAACTRFRIAQFIELLSAHGDRVKLLPFLPTEAFRHLYDPRQWPRTSVALLAGLARRIAHLPRVFTADVVFVQREAMLLGPPIVEWLATRVARRPMVLDLDDATYLDQAPSIYGRLSRILKAHGKTDRLIDWSTTVICGNESIAEHVRGRGRPALVMPTIVDTSVFVPRTKQAGGDDVPVIGWVGSHSTTDYFKAILPVLERLSCDFRFRVRVVGAREPVSISGVEVETLPWRRDREVADFQNLDIGVYPLPDDVWAEAKSGLKAIEYLSVGVPFVASPVGVVAEIGNAGETHLLARTPGEWRDAMARLLADREKRGAMGVAGRVYAVEHYSLERAARLLDEVLQRSSGRVVKSSRNVDPSVVSGFGDEWSRFDQAPVSKDEMAELFAGYFRIFPWRLLPAEAVGLDVGCGSGRWAHLVAPRVGKLICVDASRKAVEVAKRNLAAHTNCEVLVASVDELPIPDASADFAYSLGVLHHVPDTAAGLRSCAAKLKPGAPLLIYLYYALDNRPLWFRFLWHLSNPLRRVISQMPHGLRYVLSQILAGIVYWPLARLSRMLERRGADVGSMPLSYYRHRSFYVMRNDVLDRFGTRLEQRFTRHQIETMMRDAGFDQIRFSETAPYWCAVGIRR